MPTTVRELFEAVDLEPEGRVDWGVAPPAKVAGVYAVSLTSSVDEVSGALSMPPLDQDAFARWLDVRPELTLDGARPGVDALMSRVGAFWLADECVVYIGLATSSLRDRVRAYYCTPLGARRPHAGGYFLKLLTNLAGLHVHFARCPTPATAEDKMLEWFCAAVSPESRARLHDPAHPFPFANLEWPKGVRKRHGLRGAREPKAPTIGARGGRLAEVRATSGAARSQRITAADIRAGYIRFPSYAKSLFPQSPGQLVVVLRGAQVEASWNPRLGPDRERSGVLRLGRKLQDSVSEGDVLAVSNNGQGSIVLE